MGKARSLVSRRASIRRSLIDSVTRDQIVASDSASASIIKPYLRGQDIERWQAKWNGLWLIALKSSRDFEWSWADAGDSAEATFEREFSGVYRWMKQHELVLRKRQDQGRHWWELRSCAYWQEFAGPKLCIQGIAFHARIAFDTSGALLNNSAFILPTADRWVHACLNSPAMWYYAFRHLPHKKDEALAMDAVCVRELPIPTPSDLQRSTVEKAVERLIEIVALRTATQRSILDWLRVEYDIAKPSKKLQSPVDLDSDTFVAEVKRIRGRRNPLSAAALKNLRDEYTRTIEPASTQAAEALQLERQLSDLVNQAYGLTPEEVALLWATAPPRMPFSQARPD